MSIPKFSSRWLSLPLYLLCTFICFTACIKEPEIDSGVETYYGATHEIYYTEHPPNRQVYLDTTYLDTIIVATSDLDSIFFKGFDKELGFERNARSQYFKGYGTLYSKTTFGLSKQCYCLHAADIFGNGGGGGRTMREKHFYGEMN